MLGVSFTFLSTLLNFVASIALNNPKMIFPLGAEYMTLKVYCDKCGTVLYEGEELKPPYEIIEDYEGRCPKCHRKLSHIPITIDIIPVE